MASFNWPPQGGSGTVTSVGLSAPSIFTVSGSPVTGSGTLSFSLNSESANTFLAAPNGSAGVPTFRTIVAGDIPVLGAYLKADGTTPLTGSWTTGAFQILESNGSAVAPSFASVSNTGTGMYFSSAGAELDLSIAGVKQFSLTATNGVFVGSLSASNLSGTNTGDVTIGTANGLSILGQVLSLDVSSATTTGALTSADWNTFNSKQNALAFGDLTDVGTDGITITGGTGAVIGTGTSISQHVADATHNGYLSSADWSTFNSKQPAGSYITDLTGDVTATGPGSAAATVAKIQGTTVSGTTGTTNVVFSTAPTITGGSISSLTTLSLRDTSAAFDVTLAATSSTTLTAGRTLTIDTNNVSTTLKMGANLTVSGVSTINGTFTGSSSGTNTGDVTLGTANGLSLAGQVLSLQLSDTTHTGALSSTDWNTFNNKQAAGNYITALTGDVTASGPGSAAATVAKIQGTTVSGTTGTTNVVFSTAPTITGGSISSLTTFSLRDTSAAFDVTLAATSSSTLTAGRTLTIDTNNVSSTLKMGANLTVTATASIAGTNSGDVTLAAVGSSPNANGASLSTQVLTLQPADGTNPGVLTAGTQTIGGAKTFTGAISASNLSGTNTGDVTIAAFGSSPTANGATISGQAITLQPADATHPGLVSTASQTFGGSKTFAALLSDSLTMSSTTSTQLSSTCTNNENIWVQNGDAGGAASTQITEYQHFYGTRKLGSNQWLNTSATQGSSGGIWRLYTSTTGGSLQLGIEIDQTAAVRFANITTTGSAANAFLDGADNNNLKRSTSSIRYKKNVEDLKIDSSKVFDLRPVEYDDRKSNSHHFGLIAEEVAKVLPLLVQWAPEKSINPESQSEELVPDSVQYQLISVLLLKEVKKLREEVKQLRDKHAS